MRIQTLDLDVRQRARRVGESDQLIGGEAVAVEAALQLDVDALRHAARCRLPRERVGEWQRRHGRREAQIDDRSGFRRLHSADDEQRRLDAALPQLRGFVDTHHGQAVCAGIDRSAPDADRTVTVGVRFDDGVEPCGSGASDEQPHVMRDRIEVDLSPARSAVPPGVAHWVQDTAAAPCATRLQSRREAQSARAVVQ